MEIINYQNQEKSQPIVIALGYFDSIHKGHKELLNVASELAIKFNSKSASLIFTGSFKGEKNVFTLDERLIKLNILGIERVILQELDNEFMKKSPQTFIDELLSYYNVKAIVVGQDFTFGYKGSGDVKFLKEVCEKVGVYLQVVNLKNDQNGNKISSSAIKKLLDEGDVLGVNTLLGDNYFISGKVVQGKKIGTSLGFPTANIKISKEKYPLKQGVYYTLTIINGKLFDAITNVGLQPTFDGDEYIVESYINNFNGDLYGKKLTIYFIERIRDVIRFDSVTKLQEQLQKDKRWLK